MGREKNGKGLYGLRLFVSINGKGQSVQTKNHQRHDSLFGASREISRGLEKTIADIIAHVIRGRLQE